MLDIFTARPSDLEEIKRVLTAAFKSPMEGEIVAAISASSTEHISLCAASDGVLVGHVLFSPVEVASASDAWSAWALGPVGVLPEYQGRGIGSQLIRVGLDQAREAGIEVIFVLGHSAYYPRFGFERADRVGCRFNEEVPPEAFMVLELAPGGLNGRSGVVTYHPSFYASGP